MPQVATWRRRGSLLGAVLLALAAARPAASAAICASSAGNFTKTFTLDDYSLGEFTVTSHGDVATVSYIATIRFTDKGKQVGPITQRYMNTWQKQKSGWVAISSAETPVTGH